MKGPFMKKLQRFLPALVLGLWLMQGSAPAFAQAGSGDIIEKLEHGEVNWTKMTVRAWGEGTPNPKHVNPAQARIGAERAAQVDALRRLLEIAKGVRVTSESTMRDYVLLNDRIRVTVEGIVKGAARVDTQYKGDRVVVTMEMPLAGEMLTVLYREASSKLRRPPEGLAGADEFGTRGAASRDDYERNLDRLRRESAEFQARRAAEEAETLARQQAAMEAQRQAEEKARQLALEEERLKAEAEKVRADAEAKAKLEADQKAAIQKQKELEYQIEQQRLKLEEEKRRAAEADLQRDLLDKEQEERAKEELRRQEEIKRLEAEKLKPASVPAAAPAETPAAAAAAVPAPAAGAAVAAVAAVPVAEFASSATTAQQKPVDPAAEVQWSGLVLDARGLGLKPALVPRIYTKSGDDLYSAQTVTVENATKSGLVGYARNVDAAARHIRVASDPVLVKGVRAAGTQNSDLIVTDGDAKIVNQTDQRSPYLRNARVMVVFN